MYKYLLMGAVLLMSTSRKKTSVNGINFLKESESEVFKVYKDSAGYLTVGVGHKLTGTEGLELNDTITPMQSSRFLRSDLSHAERTISGNVIVPLNQNQYDALVSFVFNVGNTAFINSTLLRRLNDYDYNGALYEFSRWKYVTVNGKKKISNGLISRRMNEQNLFNS